MVILAERGSRYGREHFTLSCCLFHQLSVSYLHFSQNRYPGCACDVPSHAYTFAFALYPDWPKFLSPSEDIFRYLSRVVECFGLRSYMTFNSTIKACQWMEAEGKWHVEIQDSKTGELRVDTCDVLVGANGILNSWRFPEEVEGLHSFGGRLIHTARWPQEYDEESWKGERIAVIGSGATSVQVVPSLQPHAKQLEVFVRTPVWFVELAGHGGDNFDCKYPIIPMPVPEL
jgi:hydroxyversicolorone monooxygenase